MNKKAWKAGAVSALAVGAGLAAAASKRKKAGKVVKSASDYRNTERGDVYAMGGEVKTALNLVCFPESMDLNVLGQILQGGAEKVAEAGGILAGGHSIADTGVKYGLSVTGLINPKKLYANDAGQPGDRLILTKALGVGLICSANRVGEVTKEQMKDWKGHWENNEKGWWYVNRDGSYPVNNWQQIDSLWYFFDEEGYMKTGWIHWNEKDYFCDESGAMLVNTVTPDGASVGADGAKL